MFLPYISKNQPQVRTCRLYREPPSHFPPQLIPQGCHRAPLRALCDIQQLPTAISHLLHVTYFTYGNVYVFMLLSQFLTLPSFLKWGYNTYYGYFSGFKTLTHTNPEFCTWKPFGNVQTAEYLVIFLLHFTWSWSWL